MAHKNKNLISNLLEAARLVRAQYWKTLEMLLLEIKLQKIRYVLLMDKLSATNKYRLGDSDAIQRFITNLG